MQMITSNLHQNQSSVSIGKMEPSNNTPSFPYAYKKWYNDSEVVNLSESAAKLFPGSIFGRASK